MQIQYCREYLQIIQTMWKKIWIANGVMDIEHKRSKQLLHRLSRKLGGRD